MGFAPGLKRHELEDEAERILLEIANSLLPEGELKAARDYHPNFFGGVFPTLGISVVRSAGESVYRDTPGRPGLLVVEVEIYQPNLPIGGAMHLQDDRTGPAKKITRRIRGRFLEALFASPAIAGHVRLAESRSSDRDSAGNARTDRPGGSILWVDRTELHIST